MVAEYGAIYPKSQAVYTSYTAKLSCNSKTVPLWSKRGGHMRDFTVYGHQVILSRVTERDSGIYICLGSLNTNMTFIAQSELVVGGKVYIYTLCLL